MSSLKFGVQTSPQHVGYTELLQLWQRADALGYDSAWLFDHFMPITGDSSGTCLEGWTLLTALGVQTQRMHLGCLVTGVHYRHPAVLAKMAATVDIATGGRLEMGIGAGWFEGETKAYGIPFPATKERLAMLDEAVQVMRLLWTQETSNFQGQHYTLAEARCNPKPLQKPHPTIWIGGQGEKVTLRIVAEQGGGWDMDMSPLTDYRRKLEILGEHCANVGRDPKSLKKMIHFSAVIGADEKSVRVGVENLARAWQTDTAGLEGRVLMGTPEQAAEQLMPYVELGVEHFVLSIAAPYDMCALELYIGEIAPLVRKMAGR